MVIEALGESFGLLFGWDRGKGTEFGSVMVKIGSC